MATLTIAWTIEVRVLATALRASGGQRATVDITLHALAPAVPETIEDCINYQPICAHVLGAWSDTACAAQPGRAVRALVDFLLGFDERIGHVDVAVSTGGATVRLAQARAPSRPALAA